MKKSIVAIILFIFGIATHSELSAASSRKSKALSSYTKCSSSKSLKHRGPSGPKGDKGDTGPRGPAGSVVTECMNLANIPPSDGVLEYDLKPFCFEFSDHSPNTKCIEYGSDEQGSYILLRGGKYLVSYELQGLLCVTVPRDVTVNLPACKWYDLGTGWVAELVATIPNTTTELFSYKKCAIPVACEVADKDDVKMRRYGFASLTLSHSHFLEVPSDSIWCLRLRSVAYPLQKGKSLTHITPGGERLTTPCQLCFLGNYGASPINLSILRLGER